MPMTNPSSVSGAVRAFISSLSIPTQATLGDSISKNHYIQLNSTGLAGLYRQMTAFGAFMGLGAAMTDGAVVFDPYACEGYSGKKCDEILALVQSASATEQVGSTSIAVSITTTAGLATITSAGAIPAGVVGLTIAGTGIPAGTTVSAWSSASSATLSANATASGTISATITTNTPQVKVGIQARKPTMTAVIAGTNDMLFAPAADITAGAALARCVAGLRALWAYVRACGSNPQAVSLFPCSGSFVATAGAMTGDQLKPYKPIWNAVIKTVAEEDGVPYLDAYTPCANPDGSWKTGYTYHAGADDATVTHPSLLASLAIAPAAAALQKSMIASAPSLPRMQLGSSPIYSAAFVANDPRQFFANFGDGTFQSTAGWSTRYDPDADSSFGLFTPTQDTAGGGTIRFVKPANPGSRYSDFSGPSLSVAGGRAYTLTFDIRLKQADGFCGVLLQVVDRTPGSPSPFQPIAAISLAQQEVPAGTLTDTGVLKVSIPYVVPVGITSISPLIVFNRAAGGGSTGQDEIYVSNMPQLRTA